MKAQLFASAGLLAVVSALASLTVSSATAGRTPWGDPDLQGTWTSEAELSVPFERSAAHGTRQWLTDEEYVQRQRQTEGQLLSDNSDFDLETADIRNAGAVGSATSPPPHWLERRLASRRTSLVIDPPDGRLPAITPEGTRRLAAVAARGSGRGGGFNGPEDLSNWDRCLTRGLPGVMFPTVYNANTRIIQGPGYVAISYEMIHDTRIIPLDKRAHVSPAIRTYFGDSRGRWEGDTLVVDVTNFTNKTNYRGSGAGLHLVERFKKVDANTLRYEVTVDDPLTWAKPWTAALDLNPQPAGMFEYACHEGNYGMFNMLGSSRAADKRE
jgi:hypothetical protein